MSEPGILQQLGTAIGVVVIVMLIVLATVVAGAVWFYKRRVKRFLGKAQAFSLIWLPPRLHLAVDSDPPEQGGIDRTAKRAEGFASLGFELLGKYFPTNYPSLKMVVFSNPSNGCCAIVYYAQGIGTWSEAVVRTQSGEWISATNVTKRLHFIHLPGDRKFHEPNKSEAELVNIVLKATSREPVVAFSQETFSGEYERVYSRAANQRLLESIEDYELRQLLRESSGTTCGDEPHEMSDSDFKQFKEAFFKVLTMQLSSACVLDFMRQNTVSASEWQRSRERLLVVHDRVELSEVTRAKTCEAYVTPKLKPLLKSAKRAAPRETFAKINASLSARDRYVKLGSVSFPVAADIYRAPLDGMTT